MAKDDDLVGDFNRQRLASDGDPEIATRLANYEMAFKLQTSAPELMDLKSESAETLALYGCDPAKPSFARACLLARRMIERGVRFPDEPMPLLGFRQHVFETRQFMLINEDVRAAAVKFGNPITIAGEAPKSNLFVPMIVGDEAKGVISLQNLDREHAFSESDVRLLQTLANSMSIPSPVVLTMRP